MVLVDTSVIIDYLRGAENTKTRLFESIANQKLPYGISAFTFQEVLQGARDEREYAVLKDYLSTQRIYFIPETIETYESAAHMFFQLRRQGITPRSKIDILIVLTAINNNLYLLHNDRDFDVISERVPELRILE